MTMDASRPGSTAGWSAPSAAIGWFCVVLLVAGCEVPQSVGDAGTDMPLDSAVQADSDGLTDRGALADGQTERLSATPPVAVRRIYASGGEPCALLESGQLYCWGSGIRRNRGAIEDWVRPRRIGGFQDIVQYAQSSEAGCGADRLGNVWCYGYNYFNALGTRTTTKFLTTAEQSIDVSNIDKLAMVAFLFFGLRADGTLYVRDAVPATIHRISLSATATEILGGARHYCAVLSTGEIACDNYLNSTRSSPPLVSGLSAVASVAVGIDFFCALKRDGTVWCWGRNDLGQTGTSPEQSEICWEPDPVRAGATRGFYCVPQPRQVVGLTDVEEVSADGSIVCARRRDATVWCWGDNRTPYSAPIQDRGLIGDGLPNSELCPQIPRNPLDRTPSPAPCRRRPSQVAGLQDVRQISVGAGAICALRSSGEVWCWGVNVNGTLGDGTTTSRAFPAPVLWPVPARDE